MTRDNMPALLAASELRDVSLAPSAVRSAAVTIIHPQLRDLVLPLARGHVLYPHGTSIEEQRWRDNDDAAWWGSAGGDADNKAARSGGSSRTADAASATARPAMSRTHSRPAPDTPVGATRELIKLSFTPTCLTTNGAILVCGGQKGELYLCDMPQEDGRMRRAAPVKPFELHNTMPSRSINNAITILPTWPHGWLEKQAQWKRAYAGSIRGGTGGTDSDAEDSNYGGSRHENDDGEDDDEDDEEEEDDDDDDDMEVDEDEDFGVATYPNSLPFGHAPRMAGTGARRWSAERRLGPQYITSRGAAAAAGASVSARSATSTTSSSRSRRAARADEPRILVSNNDMTVKMFSLRRSLDTLAPPPPRDSEWADTRTPALSALRHTVHAHDARYQRVMDAMSIPPGRGLFASTFAYESLGEGHESGATIGRRGINTADASVGSGTNSSTSSTSTTGSSGLAGVAAHVTHAEEVALRSTRYLGETPSAYRVRNPAGDAASQERAQAALRAREVRAAEIERRSGQLAGGVEQRKLKSIGATKFKLAVNHSSLSPDLRTMVTVGDSTDVFLYEVIDGGREFRKIGVYNAATDSGFSTAWSKDGRKFAVASQDGQVTVWDHRTSRPLALFYAAQAGARGSSGQDYDDATPAHPALDPVSSTSGREAARVVKFSPEGSDRDLLVFSEELSNIHIIDARTFHTHVVVPVPYEAAPPAPPAPERRTGVDSQTWGISGVAFDPTGDWLYAGTERTVVEWDLRRHGGGEGGTWSMA